MTDRIEPSRVDRLTINRPHVPFGPVGLPDWRADAEYLEHAARNLQGGYQIGGYNVTTTVINLLHDVAQQLRILGEAAQRAADGADQIIAECEAEEKVQS